jgi:predicted solute-binding protein
VGLKRAKRTHKREEKKIKMSARQRNAKGASRQEIGNSVAHPVGLSHQSFENHLTEIQNFFFEKKDKKNMFFFCSTL